MVRELSYIVFHKPYGVMSTFTDPDGRPTLKDYIPIPGVYAVGRLDMDSEGLLLLTNNGRLIQRLADPQFHQTKTYWTQVEGEITLQALEQLRRGVMIQGYTTLPCQAERIADPGLTERSKPLTPHGPTCWVEIKLTEGKKHQVRHMTAAVGFPTLRLVRAAIGPIQLGNLPLGQWRHVSSAEKSQLLSLLDYAKPFQDSIRDRS